MREHESPENYLGKCRRNIAAELWGLFETKVKPVYPAWRDKMEKVFFRAKSQNVKADLYGCELEYEVPDEYCGCSIVTAGFQDDLHTKPVDMNDLRWSLVVWRNRLHLLLPKRNEGEGSESLVLKAGRRIEDRFNTGDASFFHVVGYVQPYFAELSAIKELESKLKARKDDISLLSMLAAPATRGEFAYNPDKTFSELVPSNELQRTIIENLRHKIECIQGPPGTGKSTTIFHIVQSAVPAGYHAIVTCVQNKAVDSIAEKLGPTGMPFIVYGNPSRLGDCSKRFTLDAQIQRAPGVVLAHARVTKANSKLGLIDRTMFSILDSTWRLGGPVRWMRLGLALTKKNDELYLALQADSVRLERERLELVQALQQEMNAAQVALMQGSRASLSTMDGLASANIKPSKSIVIIDEAGTVPEYKLPLLLNMHAEAIVAIGDQNQLQPFSHASKDGDTMAQDGFFQRTVKALGESNVPMLKEQYRMHPTICELVSNQFYRGELVTGDHVKAMRLRVPAGGITWLDYPESQAESTDRLRMCNMVEVDLLGAFMCDELPALLSQGKSVAVITFYKQQFLELIKMGEACGTVKTREDMKKSGDSSSRFTHPNFRIVTVDAAQGSEADVILLSCVRCNRQRNIGFIKDKNRLCVALSRARERLIVVGSRATLAVDPVWRAVMASAATH
jgi:hypothetical protein